MRTVDFKYPDLHADAITFRPVMADTFAQLCWQGYTLLGERGKYAVLARGGRFHLARYCPVDRFDGVRLIEVGETEIVYDDDTDFVEVAA